LTGKTEAEQPSTSKADPDGQYVDQVYPFIWNDLHLRGYMSFHMEDWPQVSAFTYRLKGMSNKTAHHYMRAYQATLWSRVSSSYFSKRDDFCIGAIKRHKKALNLIEEFIDTYKNKANYIAIMHYIENSHDGNERTGFIDGDLFDFLNRNLHNDLFNNTALFLYSDHGQRFSSERMSKQGYIEERTPFFSVYLPQSYRKAHPRKYKNLLRNAQQITTAFDIHETLRELTCLSDENKDKESNIETMKSLRAMSLLGEIPADRACKDIGLSFHYCMCEQNWIDVSTDSSMASKVVDFILNYINEKLISRAESFCAVLKLNKILSVKKTSIEQNLYIKVTFTTTPNLANYEALIMYKSDEDEFYLESSNYISRTNQYGNQPKCLENAPQSKNFTVDLRKFCFCNQITTKVTMNRE
jgi:hypothetical protein